VGEEMNDFTLFDKTKLEKLEDESILFENKP